MGQHLATALNLCLPPDQADRGNKLGDGMPGYYSPGESVPFAQPPRMIMDEEQDSCYQCGVRFDVLVRRHHCRRCRNIYCQKCSSYTDRLLMYGELKPVRLCYNCAQAAPAENIFVERHMPLLREGAILMRQALLAKRVVHVRVTADLRMLEETETARGGGRTQQHPLDDVESIAAANGSGGSGAGEGGEWGFGRGGSSSHLGVQQPVFVIRLRGRGQLKLEACTLAERDLWVSALEEAVRRRQSPPLADEVEEERWARWEKADLDAQRRARAEKRRENESMRVRMASKYGLDPTKYMSRKTEHPRLDSASNGGGSGGAGGAGGGGGGGGGGGLCDNGGGLGGINMSRAVPGARRGMLLGRLPALATAAQ